MAMFDADEMELIKCSCGSAIFNEEYAYRYRKVKDRLGEALQKESVLAFRVCTTCGQKYAINKNERVVIKPE